MKKLWLFFALLPLAVFSGCSESDPNSGEGPDGPETLTPVLHIVRGESFSLSCEEQDLSIVFRVDNPIGNGTVRLTGIPAWIHPYEGDETSISFTVDENEGGERRADMQLTYPQAESLTVTVLQAAAGNDRPDPETPVLRITRGASFDLSADENDCTVTYTVDNPAEGASVTVTVAADSREWVRPYEQDENGFSFTVSANEGDARRGSITLSYPGAESQQVTIAQAAASEKPVVKPSFSSFSATNVTASGATLNCSFGYTGDETIAEAGFCFRAGSAAEQSRTVAATPGAKSVVLTGLTASTTYTWYFYAEIGGELYTSTVQSFTTPAAAVDPAPGEVWRTGWPELPTEDKNNSDYYYAHHYCPDFKAGSYQARNYTVCFSAEHHCPVWVAAPRHSCYNGSANRTDAYGKDPQIPSNLQYNSKSTGGGCNKGHMLGSAERTRSTAINRQVFYYTNIAPQYSSGFNTGGGGWNTLEDWIDGKVCADTTYLVIGTYFERFTDGYGETASPKKISFGGRSDVSCPTMFYIAALRTKRGNTGKSVLNCSKDELMCAAFVRAHSNGLKGQKVTSREMMSIADLEKLTGHKFFVNVPNAPKESFTASEWGL